MNRSFVAYGGVCFLASVRATLHRSGVLDRPISTTICENCGEIFEPERWSVIPDSIEYIAIKFSVEPSILDAECKKEDEEGERRRRTKNE